jgi:hypothetical protein
VSGIVGGTPNVDGELTARMKKYSPGALSWVPETDGMDTTAWDYLSLTQGTDTDTYVFKYGGSGGSTLLTIVITYTDATKTTIDHVDKS